MTSINSNYNMNIGYNLPKINYSKTAAGIYMPFFTPFKGDFLHNSLLDKFGTKSEIETIARTNPYIKEISKEHNISLKVNHDELEKLKKGHLQGTRITAAKIYSNLPPELKSKIDPQILQEAAMLHDYGKVLIPENILNKEGGLNEKEWAIMRRHSELGSELLKDKDLSPRTIELIKYHHQNRNGGGYPAVSSNYKYGLDSEILSVADIYQALTEKRCYKDAMTKEDALAVIENDVKQGLISKEVFDALKKSV